MAVSFQKIEEYSKPDNQIKDLKLKPQGDPEDPDKDYDSVGSLFSNSSWYDRSRSVASLVLTSGFSVFGFFDGDDRVYAYSNSYRLFEYLEDPIDKAIKNYIFSGSPLIDGIKRGLAEAPDKKVKEFIRYAKGDYWFGMPDTQSSHANISSETIIEHVGANIPFGSVIKRASTHTRAEKRYKADITTKLGAMSDGGRIHVPEDPYSKYQLLYGDNAAIAPDPVTGSPVNRAIGAIGYTGGTNWEIYRIQKTSNTGVTTIQVYAIKSEGFSNTPVRIEVVYHIAGDPSKFHRYYHEVVSDSTFTDEDATEVPITFYPIIPIKIQANLVVDRGESTLSARENDNLGDDKDNEQMMVKSVKKALDIIGIDLKEVTEQIEDDSDGKKPHELYDCYVEFGCMFEGQTDAELAYLFAFFEWWSPIVNSTAISGEDEYGTYSHQIFYQEGGINTGTRIYAIHSNIIEMDIGEVGKVTSDLEDKYGQYFGSDPDYKKDEDSQEIDVPVFVEFNMYKQISPGKVLQLSIIRPRSISYDVSGEDVFKTFDYVIPMVQEVLETLSPTHQREMMKLGVMLTIHTVHIEHRTFWETSLFKIILYVVVAIIIVIMVIVTWGAGSAVVGAIGTLISGVGTVGIVATMVAIEILIAFLVNILIAVVLSVALQYLSEYLGVWGIVVFAALAIALGNYQAIGNAVQGIATSYIAVAQEVLGFVTLMAQYLNNIVLLEDQDLLEEMKEFRDDVKTMQEKMDATSDLLTEVDDSLSDPLRMRRKQDGILYESAGGFFARTLMANPGAVAIQHGTALFDSLYEYEY